MPIRSGTSQRIRSGSGCTSTRSRCSPRCFPTAPRYHRLTVQFHLLDSSTLIPDLFLVCTKSVAKLRSHWCANAPKKTRNPETAMNSTATVLRFTSLPQHQIRSLSARYEILVFCFYWKASLNLRSLYTHCRKYFPDYRPV
jgi:hypothetical protein